MCRSCGAGVYPLPTGRIRCETQNNFTLTLVIFSNCPIYLFSTDSPFTLFQLSNSPPAPLKLSPTLTKLSKRSAIDKRPGVSCMWAVCQSVYSGSVPYHSPKVTDARVLSNVPVMNASCWFPEPVGSQSYYDHGPVRFTSWYSKFNGSRIFGLPPRTIHCMTGLVGNSVWTMRTYSHKPH